MNNLKAPLGFRDYYNYQVKAILDYHGITIPVDIDDEFDYIDAIMWTKGKDPQEDYEIYLKWCELASTSLYKVLNEVD